MPNDSTKVFRKMMLNGRMNQLMTDAVMEGIAATKAAHSAQEKGYTVTTDANEKDATQKDPAQLRRFMRPIYFTPKDNRPRPQQTGAELDEEFRIPDYMRKGEPKPKD